MAFFCGAGLAFGYLFALFLMRLPPIMYLVASSIMRLPSFNFYYTHNIDTQQKFQKYYRISLRAVLTPLQSYFSFRKF